MRTPRVCVLSWCRSVDEEDSLHIFLMLRAGDAVPSQTLRSHFDRRICKQRFFTISFSGRELLIHLMMMLSKQSYSCRPVLHVIKGFLYGFHFNSSHVESGDISRRLLRE